VLADPGGDAAELASKAAADYDLELQCRAAPPDVGEPIWRGSARSRNRTAPTLW
jgi:hypothetical protein